MNRYFVMMGAAILLVAGCRPSVNVDQERTALLDVDRQWSQSAADIDKFMSYIAADGSVYPPGMPVASGTAAIRDAFTKMMSATPGFSVSWAPAKAEVGASGDVGYTTGTYEMTATGMPAEKGKYVTIWKKQADGQWKVAEDIFNADAGAPPAAHAMVPAASLTWGDAPPGLPAGARVAVVMGDPAQAAPFVLRVQVPGGYRVPPHWHPGTENLTILSGTVSVGMGDTFDQATMQSLPAGGYASMPAEMHHYFLANTAATFQVHGMGPFGITYVNAADDPRQKP